MNNKSQKKTSLKPNVDTTKPEKYKSNNEKFSRQVDNMATRKLKAQRHVNKIVWMGFGMMGLIGWSVVVPTILGTVLGIWLDKHYPGEHSRTLMLLVLGLCLGCANAWYWIDKEDKEIHRGD
jgi:ATP synthase protein I